MYFVFFNCTSAIRNLPGKHFLVFKISSRRLQDMSWRCLQYVFSVTIFHVPRRLQDVFQTPWRHVLKTSWRHVVKTPWRYVFKTSWRHVLKMSTKRLVDKQNVCWKYLYLTNLNVNLTNLYFTNLYLTNLRWIQNALIRTQ